MLYVIIYSILFPYILLGELSVTVSCFWWYTQNSFESAGNSNWLFHVEADISKLLFLYNFFIFF